MASFTNIKYANTKKVSFTIENAELAIINSIRRIILAEIPNVAFGFDAADAEHSDIKIAKNNCALHNEFLAHRISLLPLCFDENEINEFDTSKYKFVLKKQNTTYDIMSVTTKDFEIFDENGKKYPESFHSKIFPSNHITKNHILITKLKPNLYDEQSPPRGEAIDITCYPSVNTAMTHARWSPVSQCSFGNTIDETLSQQKFSEYLESHENDLGRKCTAEEKTKLLKRFNTLEVFRCFKKNKYDEANCFDFKLESECNMRPAYLMFKGTKILMNKVQNFIDNLKNKNENVVKVSKVIGLDDFYQVEIRKENFTLLNVLQNQIYNICFRETKSSLNPIDYIGYYQPHPLDDIMVLKLKMKQMDNVVINTEHVSSFLIEHCEQIVVRIKAYIKEWLAVSYDQLKDIKEVVEFKDTM